MPWQRAGRPPAADELTGAAGGERRVGVGGRAAGAEPRCRRGGDLARRALAHSASGAAGTRAQRARLARRRERPGRHQDGGLPAMAPAAPSACSPRPPGRPQAAPWSPRSRCPPGGKGRAGGRRRGCVGQPWEGRARGDHGPWRGRAGEPRPWRGRAGGKGGDNSELGSGSLQTADWVSRVRTWGPRRFSPTCGT